MLKKHFLVLIAVFMFTFSIFIYPASDQSHAQALSTALTLFPPICYTDQMYKIEDDNGYQLHPDSSILHNENTDIRIRFKVVDILAELFNKLFSK